MVSIPRDRENLKVIQTLISLADEGLVEVEMDDETLTFTLTEEGKVRAIAALIQTAGEGLSGLGVERVRNA